MCGIVGYVGTKPALPMLVSGLGRLKYRGYDSAGVAIQESNGSIVVHKRQGKIKVLEECLEGLESGSGQGIAHTRWATHGQPSDLNAHPHRSCRNEVLVHNGIIENYRELREGLEKLGHTFVTGSDSETLVHLIEQYLNDGMTLVQAVQKMDEEVIGTYGIAVMTNREPGTVVAARNGSPLVVGIADHGHFVASDVAAFVEYTQNVNHLEDGQLVVIQPDGYKVLTMANHAVDHQVEQVKMTIGQIERDGFPHFMLKEITEQPEALRSAMSGRLPMNGRQDVHLGGVIDHEQFLASKMDRVVVAACGTSLHAGMIGRRMFEKLLGIPVHLEPASELASSFTPITDSTLCIALSQSGETIDTLDAVKLARQKGAMIWGICNSVGSTIARFTDAGTYLHVGPEIGVASTKAFTAQVEALALLALRLTELRQSNLTPEGRAEIISAMQALPDQVAGVVADSNHVLNIAQQFDGTKNALYLGRAYNLPTALEGALKLKEISYIHAEGHPSGEMKHGPIALIDEDMMVVVIAPKEGEDEQSYDKVISNLEEVGARGGRVILVASQGDRRAEELRAEGKVERILRIPHTRAMFTPILASVYLQLLAYHMAVLRGCDVDQPRNLAKAVTVR